MTATRDDGTDPADAALELSNDEIEQRLCSLAGLIAATECEFLGLLAEFDLREAWGVWGMRSAAHWLSLRCGMRLGAARERVRVARALTLLPQVRAAFASGRLSYCKVRALTRVATPKTEETLVEIAVGATGAQLERIVRSWRTVLSEDMGAVRHSRRGLRRRETDDGSVVYVVRLAPEEAAVLDAALRLARAAVVDGDGQTVETPEETAIAEELAADPAEVRADVDALLLMAEGFLASGPAADKPELYQVVIHADVASCDQPPAPSPSPSPSPPPSQSPHPAPPDPGRSIHDVARQLGPPGCTVQGGAQVSPATVLRLLCESSTTVMTHAADGSPLDLGRTARHASRKQRAALRVRDGGCRFPGCSQRTHLVPHHVDWWSRGGPTDFDYLVLLCNAHHRAVHEVGYTIDVLGSGAFRFFRPDRRQVGEPGERAPTPAAPLTVDPDAIAATWGGERLDMRMLIAALAGNLLVDAGYDLPTTASRDLPAGVRSAAEWPMRVETRRRQDSKDRRAA